MFVIAKCFTNNKVGKVYIDCNEISFGWQLESDKNNVYQKSYRIILYDELKDVIYDTKKVDSSQQINIYYNDIKLESKKEYYWKVIVWNNYDDIAESSLINFETGFLKSQCWEAKWIEANIPIKSTKEGFNISEIFSYHPNINELEDIKLDPPITFYKDFFIKNKEIKKARIYITAHGIYEAKINGIKVSDEYFNPGFTTYSKLLYYQIYDIYNLLKNGKNDISITVADGWYKGRIGLAAIGHQFGDNIALLAQIEIEYIDGEKQIIGTDKSFKAFSEEIEYSDLFIGEKHNYNKPITYYEVIEKDYGYNNIRLDIAEKVRCIEKIKPERIVKSPKGEIIIDFGKNIAGIVEVKVKGKNGDVVKLQHAEELDNEGNFFFNVMGQNKYQTDIYILKGEEEEILAPKFTYHGFRYVKVISYPGEINKANFTAYILSTDLERTGKVATSNEKINKLLQNIYNSQQSNFISIPTDCPQREKAGWTGDAQIFIETAIFNMKVDNFMKRWLYNMKLDQYKNGQVPSVIPWIESDEKLSNGFGNISSAGWSDACIIIPWYLYLHYEDMDFLKDNYDMMKKWLKYVEERCASNVTESSKDYERYLWDMDFHYGD
ncbi:hypothetical protein FDN13_11630 [Caloramator sp. E03]|nr:hypothetical protein FDN13_11630 [Caloramator sp. E03]